jgi:hypothetical protein
MSQSGIQKAAFVGLLILMLGVATGWIGGL